MVLLEPLVPAQFELVAGWLRDSETTKWLHPGWREAEVDGLVLAAFVHHSNTRAFLVRMADLPVGMAALYDIDANDGSATVFLFIADEIRRGRGLGTAAMQRLVNIGFTELGLRSLSGSFRADNQRTIKMLEAAKFRHVGRVRQGFRVGDQWVDRLFMDILPEEIGLAAPEAGSFRLDRGGATQRALESPPALLEACARLPLLAAIRRVAADDPSRIALSNESSELSFDALWQELERWVEFLFAAGLTAEGSRYPILLALLPDGPRATLLQLAALACDVVFAPIPADSTAWEARRYLEVINPALVVTEQPDQIRPWLDSLDPACRILALGATTRATADNDLGEPGNLRWPQACTRVEELRRTPWPRQDLPDGITTILFTSGSTSTPKGILISGDNVAVGTRADFLDQLPGGTTFCPAPLHHAFGWIVTLEQLARGQAVALVSRSLPATDVRAMRARQCTTLVTGPSYLRLLAEAGLLNERELGFLRTICLGTALVDRGLIDLVRARLPSVSLLIRYGLTETIGPLAVNWIRPGESTPQTGEVGPLLADSSCDLPASGTPDAEQELRVRGPMIAAGSVTSRDTWHRLVADDGFFATGDLVQRGADGALRIVGRSSSFIKRHGFRINPFEIEELLRTHPAVSEAIVLGKPSGAAVEIVAAVEPTPRSEVEPAAIQEFCRERLSGHKVPREILIFPELPRTASGKPHRRKVLALVQQRTESGVPLAMTALEARATEIARQLVAEEVVCSTTGTSAGDTLVAVSEWAPMRPRRRWLRLGWNPCFAEGEKCIMREALSVRDLWHKNRNRETQEPGSSIWFHDAINAARLRLIEALRATVPKSSSVRVVFVRRSTLPRDATGALDVGKVATQLAAGELSPLTDAFGLVPGATYLLNGALEIRRERWQLRVGEQTVRIPRRDRQLFITMMASRLSEIELVGELPDPETLGEPNRFFYRQAMENVFKRLETSPRSLPLHGPVALARLTARTPRQVERVLALFGRLARAGAVLPTLDQPTPDTLAAGDPGYTVMRAPAEVSDCYFVFTGGTPFMDVLQMPPQTFLAKTGLARQSVVMFRDRTLSDYMRGVSLDVPSFDSLLGLMRDLLRHWGPFRRAYCVGTSKGALPALLAASCLRLDGAWAFGLTRTRCQGFDLAALLTAHGRQSATRLHLYYNEMFERDRRAAETLSGLPGVSLHPQDGTSGHFVAQDLWRAGKLERIFPTAEAVGAPTAPGAGVAIRQDVGIDLVIACVREVVGVAAGLVGADTRLETILDSFEIMALVRTVENRLATSFAFEALLPTDFDTPRTLASFLSRSGAKPES